MTELSSAAQAVINSAVEAGGGYGHATPVLQARLAAALRTLADQVVPGDYSSYTGHSEHDFAMEARNDSAREAILAIADELEAL